MVVPTKKIMELVLVFIPLFVYVFSLIYVLIVWLSMGNLSQKTDNYLFQEKITVLIPVRNEAATIRLLLEDLNKQSLPPSQFEVIVLDDYSTDETASLVRSFMLQARFPLRLIQPIPTPFSRYSPKKQALTQGVAEAEGTIILTTDGDCRVGPRWIEAYAQFYSKTKAVFVAGPVTFSSPNFSPLVTKISTWMQVVEFASLIGSGACAIAIKKPNMCSGANLSYTKEAFNAVKGYQGNEEIASGDDEFLLHKMASHFPEKFFFIKNQDAIVETAAHQNWASFYHQRKRWASKWKQYQSLLPTVLAIFVFWVNVSSIYLLINGLLYGFWGIGSLFLGSRWILEGIFLTFILQFLKKKRAILFIPLVQVIYPFYVLFFGIIAQKKSSYIWKDRSLT
mgnify:FL=1